MWRILEQGTGIPGVLEPGTHKERVFMRCGKLGCKYIYISAYIFIHHMEYMYLRDSML